MIGKLMTQADGSQFLIYGDEESLSNIVVTVGTDRAMPGPGIEMTLETAKNLANKLKTHTAAFDTITKEITLEPRHKPGRRIKQFPHT